MHGLAKTIGKLGPQGNLGVVADRPSALDDPVPAYKHVDKRRSGTGKYQRIEEVVCRQSQQGRRLQIKGHKISAIPGCNAAFSLPAGGLAACQSGFKQGGGAALVARHAGRDVALAQAQAL
jgi:hypothetical protein